MQNRDNREKSQWTCRSIKIIQSEKQKKGLRKNEQILSNLLDNIKFSKVCVIGVPEDEERLMQEKICKELMAEIFWNLEDINLQVQVAQWTPNR